MTDERRLYSRIAFHSPAQLVFSDTQCDVVVLDLSLKGALVRLSSDQLLKIDSQCVLRVTLSDMDDHINMQARVAHIEGHNVGIICLNIDLDSVTHLRRLVELNIGDPELLERELSALIKE
jgi:hypothetical protein